MSVESLFNSIYRMNQGKVNPRLLSTVINRNPLPYPADACDAAGFLRTVANHRIQIVKDDGVFRYLRFSDGTPNRAFQITTWPGYLSITGDMGAYVFSRVQDMFSFFREKGEGLTISPDYWAEKCVAEDRNGIRKFSPEYFRAAVTNWMIESEVSDSTWHEVEEEVLSRADDGEFYAISAAMDFESEDKWRFYDFYEVNCRVFTYHYLWLCYAIAWGIRQYDKAKNGETR